MKKSFKIYQLPVEHNAKFMSLEFVKKHDIMPKLSDYNKVYEGEIEIPEHSRYSTLDNIYVKFNTAHPEDFKGHSLSMSDVVEVDGKFHYCDSFGWEVLDWSVPTEAEDVPQEVIDPEENGTRCSGGSRLRKREITLCSGLIHFAKNGDLLHGSIKIGTWEKEDIWAKQGKYDRSGNRLVPFFYWITLNGMTKRKQIPYYSRQEVRKSLDGKKVTVTLPA